MVGIGRKESCDPGPKSPVASEELLHQNQCGLRLHKGHLCLQRAGPARLPDLHRGQVHQEVPNPVPVPERGLRCTPGRAGGQPPLTPKEEQLAHDPAQGQLRAARTAGVPAEAQPPAQNHVGAAARPARRQPQARAGPEPARVRQGPRAAAARAQLGTWAPQVRVGALRGGLCSEQGWGAQSGCLQGREGAALSPTQAFSCFFPPVSVQQCPTRAGRDPVRSGGLGAAAAASHVPATASPSQGSCLCHAGGRLARSWSVWANSTTLLRPQASQRARQALKGAAPASGPNAASRHSLSTVLWRREWHLCPPSLWSWITILGLALLQQDGHFLGVRAHPRLTWALLSLLRN
uniref:PITPNM family member 3 n=1 Tax=Macaca nemestrina TaxID=9545 RepID=A0A2K6BKB5_MACNE